MKSESNPDSARPVRLAGALSLLFHFSSFFAANQGVRSNMLGSLFPALNQINMNMYIVVLTFLWTYLLYINPSNHG